MPKLIIGCSASQDMARRLAKKAKLPYADLNVQQFPDGETRLKFKNSIKGKDLYLVQSLSPPNDRIIEVLFAAHTAKDLGAKSVTLVAPYLSYMRQDKRFYPGDCISAQVQARLFKVFDRVITIDPHLHRIHHLTDVFKRGRRLSANASIAVYIKKHVKNAIIIGPDAESYQWADKIAEKLHSHAIVLKKKRYNARHVAIKLSKDVSLKGRTVVIVDDIISSGYTMMEAVKEAKKHGARKVYCIGVHGIFASNALLKLRKLGAMVITTNTIPNQTSKIDVVPLLAEGLL